MLNSNFGKQGKSFNIFWRSFIVEYIYEESEWMKQLELVCKNWKYLWHFVKKKDWFCMKYHNKQKCIFFFWKSGMVVSFWEGSVGSAILEVRVIFIETIRFTRLDRNLGVWPLCHHHCKMSSLIWRVVRADVKVDASDFFTTHSIIIIMQHCLQLIMSWPS